VLNLPREYQLVISVFDRDESSADDLIGETQIDVENRLLSRHRAHCGISERYDR
jgi:Ca2+-dependent lipid-binding protein